MVNIKILVATHKEFKFPENDIYLPIQVGRKLSDLKLDIQGDDDGENISHKNANYCELTAIYWAWKNLKTDIIGLCHYRRYFNFNDLNIKIVRTKHITLDELELVEVKKELIEGLMSKYDIIVSKPVVYPYSLSVDYKVAHISEDFEILSSVIKQKFKDYFTTWERVAKYSNKLHPYNMFICNSKLFNQYVEWLFSILFEVEKKVKISSYEYQSRIFGFMSERLMELYIQHNNLKIKEISIYFIGTEKPSVAHNRILTLLRNLRNSIIFKMLNARFILQKMMWNFRY